MNLCSECGEDYLYVGLSADEPNVMRFCCLNKHKWEKRA